MTITTSSGRTLAGYVYSDSNTVVGFVGDTQFVLVKELPDQLRRFLLAVGEANTFPLYVLNHVTGER